MGLNNSFSGAPSNANVVGSNPLQMPDFSNWTAMNEFVNPQIGLSQFNYNSFGINNTFNKQNQKTNQLGFKVGLK